MKSEIHTRPFIERGKALWHPAHIDINAVALVQITIWVALPG